MNHDPLTSENGGIYESLHGQSFYSFPIDPVNPIDGISSSNQGSINRLDHPVHSHINVNIAKTEDYSNESQHQQLVDSFSSMGEFNPTSADSSGTSLVLIEEQTKRHLRNHYLPNNKNARCLCEICGDVSAGFHCNAYVCEACKKFFVRSSKNENFSKYICSKTNNCQINKETRTHCQKCRFYKCLKTGMVLPGSVVIPNSDISLIPCRVCGAQSSGFHFGAITCEGCKGFFRRTVNERENHRYSCRNSGRCIITLSTRNNCKSCRYRKCLLAGMSKEGSRIGRQPNAVKHICALEIEQIKSTGAVPSHQGYSHPYQFSWNESSQTHFTENLPEMFYPLQTGQNYPVDFSDHQSSTSDQNFLNMDVTDTYNGNGSQSKLILEEDELSFQTCDSGQSVIYHHESSFSTSQQNFKLVADDQFGSEYQSFLDQVKRQSERLIEFLGKMHSKKIQYLRIGGQCRSVEEHYFLWEVVQTNYDEHSREILGIAQSFVDITELETDEILRTSQYPIMLMYYSCLDPEPSRRGSCFNFNSVDAADLLRQLRFVQVVMRHQKEVASYQFTFSPDQMIMITLMLIFDKKHKLFCYSMREFKRQIDSYVRDTREFTEKFNLLIKRLSEINLEHAKALLDAKVSDINLRLFGYLDKLINFQPIPSQ